MLHEHVDRFLHRLASTRGASAHTMRAYGADLAELAAFLEGRGVTRPDDITPRDQSKVDVPRCTPRGLLEVVSKVVGDVHRSVVTKPCGSRHIMHETDGSYEP